MPTVFVDSVEFHQAVSGAFTVLGQTSPIFIPRNTTKFNVTISTSTPFVGAVALWRSFDGGVTWEPRTYEGSTILYWTAPASEVAEEPEFGVQYQLICTDFTSGTITYRISQ